MTILSTLKLVEFKPQNAGGRIQGRRRKLAEKIDQQIQLASDASYRPTKFIWVKDENGLEQRREVPKRIKRWWVTNVDGTAQLTIRYGSKALELAKGKNAIECANQSGVAEALASIKQAVMNGELDIVLDGNFGPRSNQTQKK
jgi:hypothetical protein